MKCTVDVVADLRNGLDFRLSLIEFERQRKVDSRAAMSIGTSWRGEARSRRSRRAPVAMGASHVRTNVRASIYDIVSGN